MIIIIIVIISLLVIGYLAYELFLKPKGQEILTTTISPNIRTFNPITITKLPILTQPQSKSQPQPQSQSQSQSQSQTQSQSQSQPQSKSPITPASTYIPTTPLYPFTSHKFTNAGATGRLGPTLSQVKNAYSSASWAQNNNFLNMANDNGIQLWTVPVTGNYTIQAVGGNAAQFYTGIGQNGNRRGIDISTTTTLTKGEVIKILVGQQGGINDSSQSGGGGGTFVVRSIQTPIIVAGGGGGSGGLLGSLGGYLSGPYSDASSTTNGNGGIESLSGSTVTLLKNGGSDGSGGGGASLIDENSGGGGLTGNGIKDAESVTPGLAFINGGLGGNTQYYLSVGGFGGGGSARGGFGGAGGGGYSGGGGGNPIKSQYAAGGGGGSYAINTMTINGYNSSGQGSVTITLQ